MNAVGKDFFKKNATPFEKKKFDYLCSLIEKAP